MTVISALLGGLIGLLIGFFLGFFSRKVYFDEKTYDVGFTNGYSLGKDDFFNPQAKG